MQELVPPVGLKWQGGQAVWGGQLYLSVTLGGWMQPTVLAQGKAGGINTLSSLSLSPHCLLQRIRESANAVHISQTPRGQSRMDKCKERIWMEQKEDKQHSHKRSPKNETQTDRKNKMIKCRLPKYLERIKQEAGSSKKTSTFSRGVRFVENCPVWPELEYGQHK